MPFHHVGKVVVAGIVVECICDCLRGLHRSGEAHALATLDVVIAYVGRLLAASGSGERCYVALGEHAERVGIEIAEDIEIEIGHVAEAVAVHPDDTVVAHLVEVILAELRAERMAVVDIIVD